jgi:hypothetical protein
MSRFLSNIETNYWVEKLSKSSYSNSLLKTSEILDDNLKINYRFSFSIAKNHHEKFISLFYRFLDDGFTIDSSSGITYTKLEKIKSFLKIATTKEHTINQIDYINFNFNFQNVESLKCVIFIQTIKDVIEILENYYGFDEDRNEICNILYTLGSVVSLKSDPRSEYLVDSIEFLRENTTYFSNLKKLYDVQDELILYRLSKIEKISEQSIIFGQQEIASSTQIINTFDRRLGDILDN